MTPKRSIFVTSALPYANGPIHLGHMLEHIQSDIFVRYLRAKGDDVIYVCADDCHGTPVMLKAAAQNITPEQLIEQVGIEHKADFDGFFISYDNYHKTHCNENNELSCDIYKKLYDKGYIVTKTISQLYDPVKNMFLPDRFVKGTCPKCGAADQYGDNCEVCSATYNPTDLKDAYSTVSGAKPILKDSLHYFFDLPKFNDFLQSYIKDVLPQEMSNKLQEWFDQGLKQWDISRDAPYFGFKIPNTEDKYFYVWLDAPVGYFASLKNYCAKHNIDFDSYIKKDSDKLMYHFIGKDILYFHSLFWPATLKGADYRLPNKIFVHGYVTVNGAKMSKSKGTFIQAKTYLKHLKPECLRYYFASKLNSQAVDLDLSLDDFMAKVNSDIVGKIVNLASRTASFITKKFDGILADKALDDNMMEDILSIKQIVLDAYENRNYQEVIKQVLALADKANRFVDNNAPWVIAKQEGQEQKLQMICTQALNYFKAIITYLSPVLPKLSEDSAEFLNTELSFDNLDKPLFKHKINKFKPLFARIEKEQIEAMIADSKQDLQQAKAQNTVQETKTSEYEPLASEITIDDFAKLDLRVATIIEAKQVEGAKKLLQLTLDLGFEQRQVFAGIKEAYKDEQSLVGRQVICVANLKPRQMKFGLSSGMVMAAGPGGSEIFLLNVDSGAKNGMRVH